MRLNIHSRYKIIILLFFCSIFHNDFLFSQTIKTNETVQSATETVIGIYKIIPNPCTTDPCLPCVVSSIYANNKYYVITVNGYWFCGDFSWNGFTHSDGDSLKIEGFISEHTDINGKPYYEIEVVDLTVIKPSSILNVELIPTKIILYQNYPNPFNSSTMISYSTSNPGFVILKIYDILGKEVQTLVDKYQVTGDYTISLDAKNLSSGIYFYQLQVGNDFVITKKMLLMR